MNLRIFPLSHNKRTGWQLQFLVACLICMVLLTLIQPNTVKAANQTIGGATSDGNLRIQVADSGQMGVERYVDSGWVSQIFSSSPGSKGSMLYADGQKIKLGYYGGTQATNTGNSISGNTITTSWTSGNISIVQKTTYTNGNAYYRLEWTITNHGGSAVNDLRFFHGEDTYLLGGDKGAGFWDATNNSIGVKKPDANQVEQRMTLQGVTTPYAYESQYFYSVLNNASAGALTNTLDTNVNTDNGYALEWRTDSLAAGASWTIIAFEKFNNAAAAGLSVTAPVSIDCDAGTTCTMNFSVQNVGSNSANVSLSLSGGPGWGETITSPSSPVAIAAGATQLVTVQVSVPAGTAGGTTANITLNANDGTNTSSDTAGVYVPIPPYIAPTAFTSGTPSGFTFGAPFSHTFVANGSPAPTYMYTGTLPTGLLFDGSTGVLSGTPSAPGQFNFRVTATNPGGSTAQDYTVIVAKAATAIQVGRSVAGPAYGQPIHLTATVSEVSPSEETPVGQVQFYIDGAPFGSAVSLSSGSAVSATTTQLSAGSHTYSASYLGNANNVSSSSQSSSVTVDKAQTTTTAVSSAATSVYGQPIHLTATVSEVSPSEETPVGQVQFYIDGAPFGSAVFLSSGSAVSATTTQLSAGSHTYSASYLGNANNVSSSSQSSSVTVDKAQTTTTAVSSAATSVYGQPIHLTATVNEVSPSEETPVGQVQFMLEGSPVGNPVDLNASGIAVSPDLHTILSGGHLPVGGYHFTASYLGNANFTASASSTMTQTINPAPTSVTVTSSENPTVYGTSLVMTINVQANTPSIITPAGTVQLAIDGVSFGPQMVLDSTGKAQRSVPYLNLWPGSHAVTAVYTPDTSGWYVGSNNNSAPLTQVVNKATPTFTFTSSVTSPLSFEPVTYSVTVGAAMPTQGTPTGTVQFIVDGSSQSEVTLDAQGKASSPSPVTLPAGSHTIRIRYSGDDYFASVAESPAYAQTVSKAGTVTHITAVEPTRSVVGQPVKVSVAVTADARSSGAPDGTVRVSNGVDFCVATLDASGHGFCMLAPSAPGAPNLAAVYSGSGNFTSSEAETVVGPAVAKADAQVTVTLDGPQNPVTGQPVTFRFTVTPVAPGWGTPTGSVTITDRMGRTCTATLAEGHCQITFDTAGPTGLTAAYTGDSAFNDAESAEIAGPRIAKASTTVTVVSTPAASVYGQPIAFSATVQVATPGAGTPTGVIQFRIDGVNYGDPVGLVGGSAALTGVNQLLVGEHTIGATYLGDGNFASASAPEVSQAVIKASTTLVLSSNNNPSDYGIPVLITATVTGNDPSLATPTGGMVQFVVDGVSYGSPVTLGADGKAMKLLPYTAVWVGQHQITAIYSGNERFIGSNNQASPFEQVVNKGNILVKLGSTVAEPVFGQAVGFTVQYAGESHPVPTGTVQFTVDGVALGSPVTLDVNGSATSETIASLSVGEHAVGVSYSGDDYYQPTTTNVSPGVVIDRANAELSFGSFTPTEVVLGQPVTFSFGVAAAAPGAGQPGGMVTVTYGGDHCTGSVSSGSCDLTPTNVTTANAALTITYSGDDNFLPQVLSLQTGPAVAQGQISMAVSDVSPNPIVVGQPYTVTVQVSPVAPGSLIPVGGTVTISNGVDTCTAVIQANGSAACDLMPTSAGTQSLTVTYTGSSQFTGGVSSLYDGPVTNPADTATSLMTSLNPVVVGAPVHFTATVQAVFPGSGVPTGQVQFAIDGKPYGAPVNLTNGSATSPDTYDLTVGGHVVTAGYLGGDDYHASTSAALSQKVVDGNTSSIVRPDVDTDLTFNSVQNGMPVTTKIHIPSGAVSEEVTLVLRQFSNGDFPAPEGQASAASFVIDTYVNGVLQPNITFHAPVTFTMSYNPKNWKESSLKVMGWNGSGWTDDGIELTGQDSQKHTVTFTLTGVTAGEYSLTGTHAYTTWMPIIKR